MLNRTGIYHINFLNDGAYNSSWNKPLICTCPTRSTFIWSWLLLWRRFFFCYEIPIITTCGFLCKDFLEDLQQHCPQSIYLFFLPSIQPTKHFQNLNLNKCWLGVFCNISTKKGRPSLFLWHTNPNHTWGRSKVW